MTDDNIFFQYAINNEIGYIGDMIDIRKLYKGLCNHSENYYQILEQFVCEYLFENTVYYNE